MINDDDQNQSAESDDGKTEQRKKSDVDEDSENQMTKKRMMRITLKVMMKPSWSKTRERMRQSTWKLFRQNEISWWYLSKRIWLTHI